MHTQKVNRGPRGTTDYRADVPLTVKPKIMEEIADEETGLITHYMCEGNKLYTKEGYDRNFQVLASRRMHPKGFKGHSPDGRIF